MVAWLSAKDIITIVTSILDTAIRPVLSSTLLDFPAKDNTFMQKIMPTAAPIIPIVLKALKTSLKGLSKVLAQYIVLFRDRGLNLEKFKWNVPGPVANRG